MDDIVRLPMVVGPMPNDPRLEWMFRAVQGKPPAAAKRLIYEAGLAEVGFLDPSQTEIALDALGLRDD